MSWKGLSSYNIGNCIWGFAVTINVNVLEIAGHIRTAKLIIQLLCYLDVNFVVLGFNVFNILCKKKKKNEMWWNVFKLTIPAHAKLNIQKQYICNLNLFAFDHILNLWNLNKGPFTQDCFQLKTETLCIYLGLKTQFFENRIPNASF